MNWPRCQRQVLLCVGRERSWDAAQLSCLRLLIFASSSPFLNVLVFRRQEIMSGSLLPKGKEITLLINWGNPIERKRTE